MEYITNTKFQPVWLVLPQPFWINHNQIEIKSPPGTPGYHGEKRGLYQSKPAYPSNILPLNIIGRMNVGFFPITSTKLPTTGAF